MSTNVPNLKQIGGGHRKNGQKCVDLMWNDPRVFVDGREGMSQSALDIVKRRQTENIDHA